MLTSCFEVVSKMFYHFFKYHTLLWLPLTFENYQCNLSLKGLALSTQQNPRGMGLFSLTNRILEIKSPLHGNKSRHVSPMVLSY